MIRTFFVPEGTPALPFLHAFMLPDWLNDDFEREIPDGTAGLQKRGQYSNGAPNPIGICPANHICGSEPAWLGMGNLTDDPPLEWLWAGPSTCCRPLKILGPFYPSSWEQLSGPGLSPWILDAIDPNSLQTHAFFATGTTSYMLRLYNFGVNLPPNAFPVGFVVEAKGVDNHPHFATTFPSVSLSLADTVLAGKGLLPAVSPVVPPDYLAYGRYDDNWLWRTPVPATINDPQFSVNLVAHRQVNIYELLSVRFAVSYILCDEDET